MHFHYFHDFNNCTQARSRFKYARRSRTHTYTLFIKSQNMHTRAHSAHFNRTCVVHATRRRSRMQRHCYRQAHAHSTITYLYWKAMWKNNLIRSRADDICMRHTHRQWKLLCTQTLTCEAFSYISALVCAYKQSADTLVIVLYVASFVERGLCNHRKAQEWSHTRAHTNGLRPVYVPNFVRRNLGKSKVFMDW